MFAGPSGVGKSSMLNALTKDYTMETGSSKRKNRTWKTYNKTLGNIQHRQATTYVFDTPGFSSLFVPGMTKEKLQDCFPEIATISEPELSFCRLRPHITNRTAASKTLRTRQNSPGKVRKLRTVIQRTRTIRKK